MPPSPLPDTFTAWRRALGRGLRVMTLPAISSMLALVLLIGGQGHSSLFGQSNSSLAWSTNGMLADLVAHESASRVALRRDGTLSIEDRHEALDSAAGETSEWVAMTQTEASLDTQAVSGPLQSEGRTRPLAGLPLVRAGMALSRTGHVSIVPPYVVLSRGSESIMLSLESGSDVVPEHRLPSWVSQRHPNGRVVADFGWRGTVEVHATSVSVRRRSLDWHLPDTVI